VHRPGHAPQDGVKGEVKGFELNLRLPGQYFDQETGWHDNVLRTYDPQRGEYLEPDPLGPTPNWGRGAGPWLTQPFAYANHNPITYADPTGLILFAFDGTGNDDNVNEPAMAGSGLSNVVAFMNMYDDGRKRYVSGVGTVHEDEKYGNIVPDTFAEGTQLDYLTGSDPLYMNDMGGNYSGPARIDRMVRYFNDEADLFDNAKVMDIDIIGFSRGAAQARDFANRVVNSSVVSNGKTYYKYKDSTGKDACQEVKFRFMGLWDTVLSTNKTGHQYQLGIPSAFNAVAHAVALNEYRSGGVPGVKGAAYDAANATGVFSDWSLRNKKPGGLKSGMQHLAPPVRCEDDKKIPADAS
jgi:RHS repeat-associated protein